LAASVQHTPNKRNVEMIPILLMAFLYFAPLTYFILTGSDLWMGFWICSTFVVLLLGSWAF